MTFKKVLAYINLKNLYINFKLLPITEAIYLPIIVKGRLSLRKSSGKIILDKVKFGIVKFGFFDSVQTGSSSFKTVLEINGILHFKGKANFGVGTSLIIEENAEILIGNNFHVTSTLSIHSRNKITFGENVLFAWNILIIDHDYHKIFATHTNELLNPSKEVLIGNHVWIGANVTILKGSFIDHNTVIAANSLVTHSCKIYSNRIYGGNPLNQIKENVIWKP